MARRRRQIGDGEFPETSFFTLDEIQEKCSWNDAKHSKSKLRKFPYMKDGNTRFYSGELMHDVVKRESHFWDDDERSAVTLDDFKAELLSVDSPGRVVTLVRRYFGRDGLAVDWSDEQINEAEILAEAHRAKLRKASG